VLPAPAVALRLALGEAAGVLLGGQKVLPRRALELGFRFAHPGLDAALEAELAATDSLTLGPARETPDADYLRARGARYLLEQTTRIDAPLTEVFGFFSRAENLGAMTPPTMSFSIRTPMPIEMRPGALIDYSIRLGPVPMGWRTRIEAWEPGSRFVDAQLKGPYRSWYHEHRFEADGATTLMHDRVWYSPPLGPLGRLANALAVAPQLRGIFGYREKAIRRRFGLAHPPGAASRGAAPRAAPPRQAALSS
jgi:ligand-binding SRPBCC domain-containing protein